MLSSSFSGESNGGSTGDRYVRDSESMTLAKFIERHKKNLPVQVHGDHRDTTEPANAPLYSEGDTFSIHFFKQTKVVNIQDSNDYQYTVPLNSALQFVPSLPVPKGGQFLHQILQ